MSIQDELNQIKSAVYGADVRDAIHDSIKKTYDDASANGNANMEVEMARGTEPTLNDRLGKMDDKDAEVTAQLAQTANKVMYITPYNFGAKGDGVTDDTTAVQNAIDHAAANGVAFKNTNKKAIFRITRPLYSGSNQDIDFGHAVILKTTNTKGVGSNKAVNGRTDSYEVDAFLIVKHNDNAEALNTNIRNVFCKSTAPVKHYAGMFVPRYARSEMSNIKCDYNTVDHAVIGFQWWMIPRLDNIRTDQSISVFSLVDDGSQLGQSTAINANFLGGSYLDYCIDVFGLSYSTFNSLLGDAINRVPYFFKSSKGITMNSPACEMPLNNSFISLSDSQVVVNSPYSIAINGASTTDSYLLNVKAGSTLIVNGGRFEDYKGVSNPRNFPVSVGNNSKAILNLTQLPKNGNNSLSLFDDSVLIVNDEKGMSYNEFNGSVHVTEKSHNRKTAILEAPPMSGSWKIGDRIVKKTSEVGEPVAWRCVRPGDLHPVKLWTRATSYAVGELVYTRHFNVYEVVQGGVTTDHDEGYPWEIKDGIAEGTVIWNYKGKKPEFKSEGIL